MPVPIVDVCREFARVALAAWLQTIGVAPKGKAYPGVPGYRFDQLYVVIS